VKLYDGLKDLAEHLETYRAHVILHEMRGEMACRAFPLTLEGAASQWFATLPPKLVESFEDLGRLFTNCI
jgi:hypothetical protein